MKKKLLLLVTVILTALTAQAQHFEVDGIYYNFLSRLDFTCKVSKGPVQCTGDVVIPSTVTFNGNTYTVAEIGSEAFMDCESLTSVEIPNSVTKIANHAFCFCTSLTSIEIPNSVTEIGSSAFIFCSGLTSFRIPDSVTSIEFELFSECISLASVEIPNSVISISGSAFKIAPAWHQLRFPVR